MGTEAFELPEALKEGNRDRPPLRDATNDKAPVRCQYPGCTNSIEKPARGRAPKYCPEHKNQRAASGNRSATSGKVWGRATEVENVLTGYLVGGGTGLTAIGAQTRNDAFKADGTVIRQNGPRLVHELVELAKTDDSLRKPLEWLATPGKYGPLTVALAGVIIPILGNHGLLPQFELKPMPGGGDEA